MFLESGELVLHLAQFFADEGDAFVNEFGSVECYAVFVLHDVLFVGVVECGEQVVGAASVHVVAADDDE